MRATRSRTITALLATVGAGFAVSATIGAPAAVAQPDDPTCSNGEIAMDGTCVPPTDNTSTALGIPQGNVNDVVSSLNNPSLFDPPYQLTEAEVASPGFNGGGGHGR